MRSKRPKILGWATAATLVVAPAGASAQEPAPRGRPQAVMYMPAGQAPATTAGGQIVLQTGPATSQPAPQAYVMPDGAPTVSSPQTAQGGVPAGYAGGVVYPDGVFYGGNVAGSGSTSSSCSGGQCRGGQGGHVAGCPNGGIPVSRGFFGHMSKVLHDKLIGYPEHFAEPPFGFYHNEIMAVQKTKADTHDFTLYVSDFQPGSEALTPVGASRLNRMATRFSKYLGPVVIEWTPEKPELGEARKQAILAMLGGAGLPIVPERIIVGPSPFIGLPGPNAADNYNGMISGYARGVTALPPPPTQTSTLTTTGAGS